MTDSAIRLASMKYAAITYMVLASIQSDRGGHLRATYPNASEIRVALIGTLANVKSASIDDYELGIEWVGFAGLFII